MPTFHELFLSGDTRAAADLLGEDAVFRSPVAEYRGRPTIAAVFGAIGQVLEEATVRSVFEGESETIVLFAATAGGRSADGALHVRGTDEITLFLRPLATLLPAIERMKQLLAPAA